MPLGDDLDGTVHDLDGRLVIDRVSRYRYARGPLLGVVLNERAIVPLSTSDCRFLYYYAAPSGLCSGTPYLDPDILLFLPSGVWGRAGLAGLAGPACCFLRLVLAL